MPFFCICRDSAVADALVSIWHNSHLNAKSSKTTSSFTGSPKCQIDMSTLLFWRLILFKSVLLIFFVWSRFVSVWWCDGWCGVSQVYSCTSEKTLLRSSSRHKGSTVNVFLYVQDCAGAGRVSGCRHLCVKGHWTLPKKPSSKLMRKQRVNGGSQSFWCCYFTPLQASSFWKYCHQ